MPRSALSNGLRFLIILAMVSALIACGADAFVKPSAERAEAHNNALRRALSLPELPALLVANALINQEFETLESKYSENFENYRQDVLYESPWMKGYELFETGWCMNLAQLDAWVEATESDIAYAARGFYKMGLATRARGTDAYKRTSQDKLLSMQEYCLEAAEDLEIAVEKNPLLTPAWAAMVRITMMAQLGYSPDQVFAEAIEQDSRSYYLRLQYMKSLQPRWGGTYEAMAILAERSAMDADVNPRFWSLAGAIFEDMARTLSLNGEHRAAIEMYSKALEYGDKLTWLQQRSYSYAECGDYDQAMSDVQTILTYSPEHGGATALMARIQRLQAQNG